VEPQDDDQDPGDLAESLDRKKAPRAVAEAPRMTNTAENPRTKARMSAMIVHRRAFDAPLLSSSTDEPLTNER
jgi:hypothetical protein